MAPQKISYSKLSKSGKYYRDNAGARKKKAATDTEVNRRPDQLKKRSTLGVARTKLIAKKGKAAVKGKDLAHTKGGLKLQKSSTNRGSKTAMKGDRKARGGKTGY